MDKLLEFGRRAVFVVRLVSGYEERQIRAYRMQLQKRLEEAQAKKAALKRIPEQAILSEVRRVVEEMQALNHQLEETEAAIEEYFKPIDKNAELIINMQLEKEEKQSKEMLKLMQEHVMIQKELAQKRAVDSATDTSHLNQEVADSSSPPKQE